MEPRSGTIDRPPVTTLNPSGASPFVLVCEHASNYIPARYGTLGLSESELLRHIAWDIGAADMTRGLAERLDAVAFLAGASRLLIDCNRPLNSLTSIPEVSEIPIPGNHSIDGGERRLRALKWFEPFHSAISIHLDHRRAQRQPATVIGVHSFTPVLNGVRRKMHAGVLFSDSVKFGMAVLVDLRRNSGLDIAENAPYRIDAEDWTIPFHADQRKLTGALLEIRHDGLESTAGIDTWVDRSTRALKAGWDAVGAQESSTGVA